MQTQYDEGTNPKICGFLHDWPKHNGKRLSTTLVCPSVWGWQEVEKFNLVPSLSQRVLQKWTNLGSLSGTMVLGKPCSLTISLKKSLEMLLASSTLRKGIDPAGNSNVEESLPSALCPVYATAFSAKSPSEPSLNAPNVTCKTHRRRL